MADERSPDEPPPIEEPRHLTRQQRVMLHMPVDVRSVSLATLAVVASLYMMHWAAAVFVPLLLSIMFTYALSPLVDRLVRWHVPRAIGAGLLLVAILGTLGGTAYALADDANSLVESLPDAAQKLRRSMRAQRNQPESAIDKVQKAAAQLEQAALESGALTSTANRGVMRVQIERPRFNIKDYFWSGTLGAVQFLGQVTVVFFLTFFLLASGNTFRRKIVKISGRSFRRKKVTVRALDEITRQMQIYLLVQILSSLVVGLFTGLAFTWIGLQHAAVWGVVAAVLNLIPYIGTAALMALSMLLGFMQFGSIDKALLIGAVSLVIHIVQGQLVAPWLTSRTCRLNTVVIFVGVLAWGWLWGVWGLLLGVPLLMVLKAVCDRVDDLKAVGELLGN
jgi:predicted PurR-regulated permease PerM